MNETGLEFWSLAMCFILELLLAMKKNNGSCSSVGLMAIIINRYFDSSTAAALKNGQSDRKRNPSKTNVECRLTNVELRNSFYFIC